MRLIAVSLVLLTIACNNRTQHNNQQQYNNLLDSLTNEISMDQSIKPVRDSVEYVQKIAELVTFGRVLDSSNQWTLSDSIEGVEGIESSEGNMAFKHVYDSLTRYSLRLYGCGGRAEYVLYSIGNQLTLMRHKEITYTYPNANLVAGNQLDEVNRVETNDGFTDYYFKGDSIVFRNPELDEPGYKGLIYTEIVDLGFGNRDILNKAFHSP